jgi:hypothetical protein
MQASTSDFRASEDWDLWIRFIWAGEQAGFVEEALATCVDGPGA